MRLLMSMFIYGTLRQAYACRYGEPSTIEDSYKEKGLIIYAELLIDKLSLLKKHLRVTKMWKLENDLRVATRGS